MRLHHVAIVCSSQERADQFYEGILGLRKIKTAVLNKELAAKIFDLTCECQIILYGNESFAVEVFVAASASGERNPFEHLCLEVKEREKFLAKCQSNGLEVKRIPRGDSLLTFVRDYDGNMFEVKELAS